MSEFIRPQVSVEQVNDTFSRFIVEPLERGYGDTLGNSMRRVLLSSLDGAAVEAIEIAGVQHEFSTIPGVVEDVTDIVLNVKGLIFRANGTLDEAVAEVYKEGPCVVTGGDFKVPAGFDLINPEQVIATLNEGATLDMNMRLGVGRGYVSAEGNKRAIDSIGVIHVDSLFSPVKRVAPLVKNTRVGQRTDYDSLLLEVETNGAIDPIDAVYEAANIITQHMNAFMSLAVKPEEDEVEEPSIFAPEEVQTSTDLDRMVEDLDLSVRAYNCLKRAGIHSVRQLVEYSEIDLLNIRNFGAKSIEEVKDKLISLGLNLRS